MTRDTRKQRSFALAFFFSLSPYFFYFSAFLTVWHINPIKRIGTSIDMHVAYNAEWKRRVSIYISL